MNVTPYEVARPDELEALARPGTLEARYDAASA